MSRFLCADYADVLGVEGAHQEGRPALARRLQGTPLTRAAHQVAEAHFLQCTLQGRLTSKHSHPW